MENYINLNESLCHLHIAIFQTSAKHYINFDGRYFEVEIHYYFDLIDL